MTTQLADHTNEPDSLPSASAGLAVTPSRFISQLLREQRELTAVEQFAKYHAAHADNLPQQYHRLIPLSQPQAGEQYAFDVDLDKCSGCKACVSACHHMNGLETHETWRSVGVLTGQCEGLPVLQHVTTACHHCIEPSCLAGCPTNAYVKDAQTGIVRHLDDQCFGCQYCTMACPYEVPQYDHARGVVRKCDMCQGRLAHGEPPACVQACPSQAIRIVVVSKQTVRSDLDAHGFLPASPSPSITTPTTRYHSTKRLPTTLRAGNAGQVTPQPAHLPLVAMLVLTQWSVGAATIGISWNRLMGEASAEAGPWLIAFAWIVGAGGNLAALAHLGRPWLAFRSVLGWKHSWLSREVIAFALYQILLTILCVGQVYPRSIPPTLQTTMALLAVISGWSGIYCSVRIYQFTRRAFWSGWRTSVKFGLTPVVLGLTMAVVAREATLPAAQSPGYLGMLLALTVVIKLILECLPVVRPGRPVMHDARESLRQTRQLLTRPLVYWSGVRLLLVTLALLGIVNWFTIPVTGGGMAMAAATPLCLLVMLFGGEMLERWLFFRAVVPLRMPGGVNA